MLYYLYWGIIGGGGDLELKYICLNLMILILVIWFSVFKYIIVFIISKLLCIKEIYKNLYFEFCFIWFYLIVDKIKRIMNLIVSCFCYFNKVK